MASRAARFLAISAAWRIFCSASSAQRPFEPHKLCQRWLASDVYKADVYDTSDHKVGNVTDLMIDCNGNVMAAIIGVGGFLGVGEKDVAIPFKELRVSTRDGKDWLVLNRTQRRTKNNARL